MMKTKIHLQLCIMALLLLFTGCQKSEHGKAKTVIETEKEYIVGIKAGSLETKGRLFFKNDGTMHFIHEDQGSILFGMEEVITDKKITVKYKGIEWESDEVDTNFTKIKSLFDVIVSQEPTATKSGSVRGNEGICETYDVMGYRINFWKKANGGEPIQISGEFDGIDFEINFSLET